MHFVNIATEPPTTYPGTSSRLTNPQTTRTLTTTATDTHGITSTLPTLHPHAKFLCSVQFTHSFWSITPPLYWHLLNYISCNINFPASRRSCHTAAASPAPSLRRSMKDNTEMQTVADTERKGIYLTGNIALQSRNLRIHLTMVYSMETPFNPTPFKIQHVSFNCSLQN